MPYFVIAILGIGFIFANNDVSADGITSSGSFLKKCNDSTSEIPTPIPQSGNSSSPKQGMLLMKPNSVAMICVKYLRPSGWHSSIDINNTKLDHPFPVKVENIHVSGNSVSFGNLFVNNVMVSKAQPNTISFGPNDTTTSTVILYTVSARPDSRGYYHLGLPYVCRDIPLAVGYDTSQLDASAFQDLDTMCFNFGVETSLVGISGANMTYVDISNKPVHSTKLAENISIIPPLQQVKFFDTSAKSVRCNTGLQLIIKAEDGSSACVKPDTTQILVERGWARNTAWTGNITGISGLGTPTIGLYNVTASPQPIILGMPLFVTAEVSNNQDAPITYYGGCASPLSVYFSNIKTHADGLHCLAMSKYVLGPHEHVTVQSEKISTEYNETGPGYAYAEIKFSYDDNGTGESWFSSAGFPVQRAIRLNCTESFGSQMEKINRSVNVTKAIALAHDSPEFLSKEKQYGSVSYMGFYNDLYPAQSCSSYWKGVEVMFSADTGNGTTNIRVTEDIGLTRVLKVEDFQVFAN
ncbi:MAG: hypothetical protein KGI27_00490 [Thaumarchaeota archaeon]|nr:hypothetical protein [Nitrososphaerota archaeon]